MKCPRCQHDNPAGAKFCEECATPLARVCVNCGTQLSPAAKFCPGCAHPTGITPTTSGTARFSSPELYTPKHLAERILTSKTALEGERKQVTVLFADLKGSMELLADRDPEDARKILDPVLELMMEAVHRYEGTVNQVMGDGIMALFGAPLAHEDHAVRACYAALRVQESVKRYAEGVRRVDGIPIRVRVGLNSGEVVVRAIGSDLHMDYTAVGQTTHLAARMEQVADSGAILMTPAVFALAEGFVDVKSLGPTPIKGLAEPVEIFELTAARAVRSRLHAAAARGLTKFVGRSAELIQLQESLDLAAGGKGQVVAVVGEPGVGKSRLYWEFTHSHRTAGCLVVEAASVSYGKATAFYPVIELLKAYFAIELRDDLRKIREKVTGKLLSLDRTLESSLSALLFLLDVPTGDQQWERLDSPQRRERTLEGVKQLVLRETQVQPMIVVFEDLHWIDGATQALLDKLIDGLPTSRLLLLVNYRPEYTHGWGSKTYYRQLRVDPLPTASAAELLKELLGSDPALAELQHLLIERTQCNPFFLEESVHALVETSVLTGERGSYRLAGPIQHLQLPSAVQTILAARIDRLDPEDKRLLQAAAVIGKDVPHALLQAVADEPDERVRVALQHLRAAEFLYERSLFPELEYTFKHALTVEVAYASVLSDRRRDLHARVARTLAQLYTARLEEHAERLAYHALHGELWEDAVRYGRLAGARAESRSAFNEAARHYQTALAALARLPKDRANVEEAIDLHTLLRTPLWTIGHFDEVLVNLREAERLARELEDTGRLHYAELYLYNLFWIVGNHGESQRLFPRVQAVAADDDTNPSIRAYATMQLGQTCLTTGNVGDIRSVFESVLPIIDAGTPFRGGGEPRVQLRALIALIHAYLGEFREGIAWSAEAVEIADSVGTPYIQVYATGLTALLHCWRGDFASSLPLADRGLRLAEAHGFITQIPFVLAARGWALCGLGRGESGVPLLERGVEVAKSSRVLYWHTNLVAILAEGQWLVGDVNRSTDTAARALDLARARREPGFEAWSLRLLGDVASASRADTETAERSYQSALSLAQSLRLRPLVAHCHRGLGQLYRRDKGPEHGHEHLTTASAMYREMGMTYWLEKIGFGTDVVG